jgi:uncharacterized membrane protein YebE (DUF533 family)
MFNQSGLTPINPSARTSDLNQISAIPTSKKIIRKEHPMAKSLLESLINGAKQLSSDTARGDLATKAQDTWNNQSNLTKGAIAGGLLGVLLSGNAGKILKSSAKVGGAAVIGGLAYKAYQDWQSGKQPDQTTPPALPPAAAPDEDELSFRLLQAMISATKADGQITPEERVQIYAQIPRLGLGNDAALLIAAELDAPFDPNRIAALARNDAEAAQIYAASLLAVDPDGLAEKGYLAMLAARLKLDAGLVAHLHANAASLITD